MEKVADVLRHKFPQFNTSSPNRLLTEALNQMHCENTDYLIIIDNERFVGLLTEHGIIEKLIYRSREMETAVVKDFMTTFLPIATLNDTLEYCMQLMERYNVRHLAVYDRFTFKGIVSAYDLMKETLSKRKASFDDEAATHHSYPWDY